MARKKKKAMDILGEFSVEIDYLADELDVSRQTVRRWFKDITKKVDNWTLAPADEVITFLSEYKNGKYIAKLCDPYKPEDYKDKDVDGDDMYEIIQSVLEKIIFVADCELRDDNLDEIERDTINHIYKINLVVY